MRNRIIKKKLVFKARNKNSIKINKNSLLIESVKVNYCQRLGNANGQDQKKKYFSNKEGIARS